jgi:hypothetical protein
VGRAKRAVVSVCLWVAAILAAQQCFGQTYYVSPTGSDSNSGLSPESPWQSLSKVDSTTFAPGSTILFQDGGQWYDQLTATSSGTTSAPITYGSYGSGTQPIFWGSNVVSPSAFQPVSGAADTYTYSTDTTVNSFLVNHQFSYSASLASGSSTDATNISYVENDPNSWYYDSDNDKLYVNTGSPISSSNVYTAAVRQDEIFNNGQSNLVFENLTVEESAQFNGGYGIRVQAGSNVHLLNDNVVAAGKHGVGDIDATGFVAQNVTVSNLMPNLGYGGASAFVTFTDNNYSNTTAQWTNDTFNNTNGQAYQSFISHSTPTTTDPTPISSLIIKNMIDNGGEGVVILGNDGEQIEVLGGQFSTNVSVAANNAVISGIRMNGLYPTISLQGNNNILENSIIKGQANFESGHPALVTVQGQNNILQSNTFDLAAINKYAAADIALMTANSGTQINDNIIKTYLGAILQYYGGDAGIEAADNLFAGTSDPQVIFYNFSQGNEPIIDLPPYEDMDPMFANPTGIDEIAGNFLLDGPGASDPSGSGDASVPEPAAMGMMLMGGVLVLRRRRAS